MQERLSQQSRATRWRTTDRGRVRTFATALAVVVCLAAAATALAAQAIEETQAPTQRPRIGLSLGGGGARGIAHIGVLHVLEELHIPVDYIAGTSMGAIVGSLYALGLSADEIEEHLLHVDWADVLSDHVNRQKRSFRRKEDDQANILGLEFGLKGGFTLPRSLATGKNLAFALPVPGLHTEGRDSFDDLPIPFRAVASNMATGEPVILDHGSLFRAVRASMTVPLAFPPIHSDSLLMVDGVLTLNNPVSVVRDMGADIVIAVSVDELPGARSAKDLDDFKEYLFQLLAVGLNEQVEASLAQADIVIRPALTGIHMDDFTRGAEAVAAGHESAAAQSEHLKKYSLLPQQYASLRQKQSRAEGADWHFDETILVNHSRVPDAVLERRLRLKDGEKVNLSTLRTKLERVYDLDLFEAVEFDIDAENGRQNVTVTTTEKSYAPNIFRLGAEGQATFRGDTQFSLLARLTRLEMNPWGAEWRTNAVVGTRLLVDTELYQPIGLNRWWFVSVGAAAGSRIQYIYENDAREAVQQYQELFGGVDVGLPLGRMGELRSGLRWGWVGSGVVTGQSPLPSFDGKQGLWATQIRYDMLDSADFPHAGGEGKMEIRVSADDLGAENSYERILLTWAEFLSYKRATTFWSIAGGGSFGSELPPQDQFLLGGFDSFAGYNADQYRGNYLGTVRIGTDLRLGDPMEFIGTQWYSGLWGDVGNVWPSAAEIRANNLRVGGAFFVGADTIVGPAIVTGSFASNGGANVYITLGLQVGVQH